jgi:hypothetical protein
VLPLDGLIQGVIKHRRGNALTISDVAGEWRERAFCKKKTRRKAKMTAKRRFFQELEVQSYNKDMFKL